MKNLIILLVLFSCGLPLFSQDYYWVGGSGNWSDFANHWATTSNGSTFHTQPPTASDNVIFDANSFDSFGQVVTLDAAANCLSMDWTGVPNFPVIDGNGNAMDIYASLTLAADMTADFDDLEFEATSTGHTITTNGTSLGTDANLMFVGVGGGWTLQDNLETENLNMTAGSLDTNGNNLTIEIGFNTSGSNSKTIVLGSSEIAADRFWIGGTNITMNAGTSKIITTSFYSDRDGDGPFTYYDVEFYSQNGRLRYNSTFNEITIPDEIELELRSGDIFTVGNLVSQGDKFSPSVINTTTSGSEATFEALSGSIILSYVELSDIHATGAATFTANNSTGNGNTTGWTINAPVSQNYYWVGNAGDWTDFASHWATSSGGTTFHTDYPARYDNVFFDINSFTVPDETVTLDIDVDCNDMDWTGVTNSPRLYGAFGLRLNIYGSATFTDEVDKDVYTMEMEGSGTHTLTYGETGRFRVLRLNGSGTVNFQDSVSISLDLQLWDGVLNLNNNPLDVGRGLQLIDGIFNAGASNIYCDNFDLSNSSSSPVFNEGTSTVQITDEIDIQSTSNRSFDFYNVVLDGTIVVEGSHTIENLTIKEGSSISFEESTTTTVTSDLVLPGTKANPISLASTLAGTQVSLSKATGTVNATYLILQDINVSGGATFNATETIDNGNNTGWNITGLTGDDYYWVGDGGNWSDFANHWTTTSGGSTFHVAVPGVLDNVIFDANSFSQDSEVVVIDGTSANFNDFDASLADQFFTISGSTKEMNIYGSLDLSVNSNLDIGNFNFLTTGSTTIDFSDGPGSNWIANFLSGGTWTLESDVVLRDINFESGTINTNGYYVDISQFFFLGSESKTLNLGTSTLESNSIRSDGSTNTTINGGSSEIIISGSLIVGSDVSETITLNNLTVSQRVDFYTDLTLSTLTFQAGSDVSTVGDRVLTVDEFIAVGTELDPIIIEPQTVSSSLTISQSTGVVNGYFLEMEEVTATGGATFNAFNSIDNGNVIGWIFNRLSQTITFDPIADKSVEDDAFTLEATASSGLDVSFEIISGPAIVSENLLTITGAGTVEVQAKQSGDVDYNPAPSVFREFTVAKGTQSIFFESLPEKTFGEPDFSLVASSTADLVVDFASSDLTIATIENGEVIIVGAGSTVITASQPGNDDYEAAMDVEQTLVVDKASQQIIFEALTTRTFGDAPFTLSATGGNSGNAIVYISSDLDVVTIDGNEVTIVGAGSVTITASQIGNDNYHDAVSMDQLLTIAKANQTISFPELNDFEIGIDTNPIALAATASSGLLVSYETTGPATLIGSNLTPTGVGTVTVTALQSGDVNFEAATKMEQSFEVIESVLGLDSNSFHIYPNPVSNYLKIEGLASADIIIYTLKGELAKEKTRSNKINLSDLNPGVYLLNLVSDTKKLYATKIVIAR
ncbi:T9SS type A sorting domain-containing protein [Ekhidna sp.]